jgi:cell wall-active antibiotic response 4TMS protein YvqF
MNCANHTDVSAVAYCRTCGKALCANCTRDVRGVIYCENCLAARMEGTQPPIAPVAPGYSQAVPPSGGPNPAVAGILAGFFPFGVGAVYTSQYAKSLAHLLIFVGLIWGMDHGGRGEGVFVAAFCFFWVYQIIDAVRSARAIQMGLPAPDPFGLAQALGAGEKIDTAKIPTGAIVLIALGSLFLLQTLGVFSVSFDRIWPVFLIALGAWLFARNWGLARSSTLRCYCDCCRTRRLTGPAILVTVGVLGLIDSFRELGFFSWVGAILIVVGVIKLLQNNASSQGHVNLPTSGSSPNPPVIEATPQPPANEVKNV